MRVVIIMFGLLLISAANAADVAIDRILPSVAELGTGWTSNCVGLLVDPLSSPTEVADSRDTAETHAFLRSMHDGMRKSRRTGQAFVRYYHGSGQYGVFVSRFDSESSAEANWAKSTGEGKAPAVSLSSPVGERFRFSIRDGIHNDLTFLRGRYYITVEGGLDGWEQVKHLARFVDDRLLRQTATERK
jgi:hypothetical protein